MRCNCALPFTWQRPQKVSLTAIFMIKTNIWLDDFRAAWSLSFNWRENSNMERDQKLDTIWKEAVFLGKQRVIPHHLERYKQSCVFNSAWYQQMDFYQILEFVWRKFKKNPYSEKSTNPLTSKLSTSRKQRVGRSNNDHKQKPQWLQDFQAAVVPTCIVTSIMTLLMLTQEYDFDLSVAFAGGS
jgi:hypothetical protein